MLKHYPFLLIVLFSLIGCRLEKSSDNNSRFAHEITLDGDSVMIDTIAGVVGAVRAYDDSYILFLYDSDNFLMIADSTFTPVAYSAPKGQGPSEVQWVTSEYGYPCGRDSFHVFDPYSKRLYRTDLSGAPLDEVFTPGESLIAASPRALLPMSDGHFAGLYGTSRYGMFDYDPENDSINIWPVGVEELEAKKDERTNYSVTSLRSMAYEPTRKLVGEIYGKIPVAVIHNEDGSVYGVIRSGDMPDIDLIKEEDKEEYHHIRMTTNYIYLLHGDAECSIIAYDYDLKPVAKMSIRPASHFDVDAGRRRFVAVDPNSDSTNIMVYPIPEFITAP